MFQALQTGLVSYVELDTVLGLEDALNIIEVHQVAEHNKMLLDELRQELQGNGS